VVAVVAKHEIVLALSAACSCGTVSVIVQVVVSAHRQARVRMAPIHHHYEHWAGRAHHRIRFWIVAVVLALAGLATLKLR